MSALVVKSWDLLGSPVSGLPSAPAPDETWELPGGTAWVYYGTGNTGLVRPVILADGFRMGPSNLDELWFGYNSVFPFLTQLRERSQDVIILGYDERSASILDNAEVAIRCISRTIQQRSGDAPLTVCGFSMGGLVTRYALAKMERLRINHETATYLSYDSPHRGAWIPVGVQAAAHFVAQHDPTAAGLSKLVNSPAGRQLLWWHVDTATPASSKRREDPLRTEFLERLDALGGWPSYSRKLGVAAGRGDGTGNGVPPGAEAVRGGGGYTGTVLYTQASGDERVVAELVFGGEPQARIRTSGAGELDSVAGGTLNSFDLAAAALRITKEAVPYPYTCFVPTVSAVAVAELDSLDSEIGLPYTELDDFFCSSQNLPHSAPITAELGTWILKQIQP